MPERKSSPEVQQGIQESAPEKHETEPQAIDTGAPVAPAPVVQLPSVPIAQQQDPAAAQQSSDNPIVASDDDLIEKEWITKAKQVVQSTKSDPYMQEAEVSRLQADYLKKRYGKDIKLSSS